MTETYDHVFIHVPHSSTVIPDEVWETFNVPRETVERELVKMTDWFTQRIVDRALGSGDTVMQLPQHMRERVTVIASPVSRLVVDVERFDGPDEIMNESGMGVVYTRGHDGKPIRDEAGDYSELVERYYLPHKKRWVDAFEALPPETREGKILVIDIHSFPETRLPYEVGDEARPQLCIGVDELHTPPELVHATAWVAAVGSLETSINSPFAGCYVPDFAYRTNPNVHGVMLEIRRDLYMDEAKTEYLEEPAMYVSLLLRRLIWRAFDGPSEEELAQRGTDLSIPTDLEPTYSDGAACGTLGPGATAEQLETAIDMGLV